MNLTPYAEVVGCKAYYLEDYEVVLEYFPEADPREVHGFYDSDTASIYIASWAEVYDRTATHEFVHYVDHQSGWSISEQLGDAALEALPNSKYRALLTNYSSTEWRREAVAFLVEESDFVARCYETCKDLSEAIALLESYIQYLSN